MNNFPSAKFFGIHEFKNEMLIILGELDMKSEIKDGTKKSGRFNK